MRSLRFWIAVAVSIGWLGASGVLLYVQRGHLASMPPNAWGDFCAGVFSPLAFLWLVLGYLQQGDQLELNSKALQLQAEELKNSVEQQRALVEVSRQQVDAERSAIEFERERREEEVRPKWLVSGGGGSFNGNGQAQYNVLVTNAGGMVTDVVGTLSTGDKTHALLSKPIFQRAEQWPALLNASSTIDLSGARLVIECKDALGRRRHAMFAVRREKKDDPHSGLLFEAMGESEGSAIATLN